MPAERLRLGLLVLSSNSVIERDFYAFLPDDVTLHVSRVYLVDASLAAMRRMHASLPEAAELLGTVRPHLAVMGCTSISGMDGARFDGEVVPQLEARAGAPILTIMAAAVRTFRRAGVRTLSVVTPYPDEINDAVRAGLEANGLIVRDIHGLGIEDNFAMGQVTPDEIVAFTRERVPRLEADALFLSCANFRAAETLPALREVYGPRVYSSLDCTRRVALEEIRRIDRIGARLTPPAAGARA